MRVIVFGNNRTAVQVAVFCRMHDELDLVAVIPEGWDLMPRKTPHGSVDDNFDDFCDNVALDVLRGSVNGHADVIRAMRPDIMFGCRSHALVSPEILAIPPLGVTNIHYGMLPRYGGCSTIQHAILAGEDHIGVTLHFMSEQYDTGPIIAQRRVSMAGKARHIRLRAEGERDLYYFTDQKTAHDLYVDATKVGVDMFKANLGDVLAGWKGYPQEGARTYFKADAINFERDRHMDIRGRTRTEINRHYRAFHFPAKQVPEYTLDGKPLTLDIVPYAGTLPRPVGRDARQTAAV